MNPVPGFLSGLHANRALNRTVIRMHNRTRVDGGPLCPMLLPHSAGAHIFRDSKLTTPSKPLPPPGQTFLARTSFLPFFRPP
jgi:hypothetical protein